MKTFDSSPPTEENEHRLSVRVDKEQWNRISALLPHGIISHLIRGLLWILEEAITSQGFAIVQSIIKGEARLVPLDSKIESSGVDNGDTNGGSAT